MAASVETSQYERDLRSAKKEWKRTKDSAIKWSRGSRHLPGIRFDYFGRLVDGANASESQLAKSRPNKRLSEVSRDYSHRNKNLVKMRANWDVSNLRLRSKLHARSELRDAAPSELDPASSSSSSSPGALTRNTLLSAATTTGTTPTDAAAPLLYSFDRAESPGRPLTLDIFVKTTGRETERLVEREYEILDENGEALRGLKAKKVLRGRRKAPAEGGDGADDRGGAEAAAAAAGEDEDEDDGFELV
ncbi:hypothetical protein VTK56DRAFT_5554 [Thermocarpiscus australiensis]